MADFKSPAGSFDNSHGKDRDPKQSGVPSAGITNESRGKLAPTGAGPGVGPGGTKIH